MDSREELASHGTDFTYTLSATKPLELLVLSG
jgi:hypothetical protein